MFGHRNQVSNILNYKKRIIEDENIFTGQKSSLTKLNETNINGKHIVKTRITHTSYVSISGSVTHDKALKICFTILTIKALHTNFQRYHTVRI